MNMKAVAASLPRRDGRDKVTGPAPYIANMDLPGMLHCTVLRSPLPHARILRIDKARAEALPGVVTVLTGADLAGDPGISPYYGPAVTDQPILAIDRVRFVGEPVAAVAAETLDIAGQAVDLIEVEYEELPPVTSAEEALAEGAPVLHEQVSRPAQAMGDLAKTTRPIHGTNIVNHFHVRRGDAEAALREADGVVEGVYRMPNVQHAPMEPHGALALWDRGGKLTVWSCTQTPYVVRQQLAAIFRRPQSQVRVIVPYIGGGYGSKTYPKLEPLA
ncbi:MAG: molybdopterin-dependent oxidoreductase, partial [Actinobacteria bacterium]|nr:molybdopterin-dependent oxidoreductase [Actinomycetota bacterium]